MYEDWVNPPYKGGWLEICLARKDDPEYSKPRGNSQVALPPLFSHWMVWRGFSRMSTFDHGRYWTPGLVVDKGRRWEKSPLSEALCLIPEESVGQSLWEGLENQTDFRHRQDENGGIMQGSGHSTLREFSTSECCSREFLT